MTDDQFFRSLPDFEDFAPFLEGNTDGIEIPPFVPDFSTVLIVDSIPKVGPEKLPKLKGVLLKIYMKIHDKLTEGDVEMPMDEETKMTLGFCFIKFQDRAQAEKAMEVTQGFAIDKKHKFEVSLYSDLDKYGKLGDTNVDEEYPAFKSRPDPTSWLSDPACRDQFVIRHSHETVINWANTTGGDKPSVVYDGDRFEDQGKFGHNGVQELTFSPCEKYLITYAFPDPNDPGLTTQETLIVWDILSQSKLRAFEWKNPLLPMFQVEAQTYLHTDKMIKEGKDPELITIRGRVKSYNSDTYCFTVDDGNKLH
eukprot:GSChrysophyteH1.ASY1.ANO1.671.1 assembled CDS